MHRYLKEACSFAATGDPVRKCFVGAIGVRRDGTVVRSFNIPVRDYSVPVRDYSVPVRDYSVPGRKPAAHAEARLCRKLDYGSVVYVGRVRRDTDEIALAKPCARCESALRNSNVRKVLYTIGPGEWGVMEF